MAQPYTKQIETRRTLGLIALQADRTIEDDFRRLMPGDVSMLVSRVPSALEVTLDTLAEMEGALTGAAALFPVGHRFDVVGYGCTSGTAQIGAHVITERVKAGADADQVSEPVSALIAACRTLGLRRIAILSPYVASVSDRLRHVLRAADIETPTFDSFDEANEAAVTQIDGDSISTAAGRWAVSILHQLAHLGCDRAIAGPIGSAGAVQQSGSGLAHAAAVGFEREYAARSFVKLRNLGGGLAPRAVAVFPCKGR
jgi:maleate isomerase